jgi:hypothetical protein
MFVALQICDPIWLKCLVNSGVDPHAFSKFLNPPPLLCMYISRNNVEEAKSGIIHIKMNFMDSTVNILSLSTLKYN